MCTKSRESVSPPGLIFECNSKPQSHLNSCVLFEQYCHNKSIHGFCFKEYPNNVTLNCTTHDGQMD